MCVSIDCPLPLGRQVVAGLCDRPSDGLGRLAGARQATRL